MKRTITTLLVVAGLWMPGCADNSIATPPTGTPTSTSGTTVSDGNFRGRIVDTLSGHSVPGVRVAGSGEASTTTSAGSFTLGTPGAATIALLIEGESHWTRRTHALPSGGPVTIDIIPKGRGFDLDFFDHVFRELGNEGTQRWVQEPRFEIWDRVYECTAFADNGGCSELVARADAAPAQFVVLARDVIRNHSQLYSGGAIKGSSIHSNVAHAAGSVIPRADFFDEGRITIAFVVRPDDSSWGFWRFDQSGEIGAGHMQINRRHRDVRGVYSHELAHTLGFAHPLGLDKVPARSIMRIDHGDEPTRIDILHGRILYARPPNSRTPDDDPADYIVNAARDEAGRPGGLTIRFAR